MDGERVREFIGRDEECREVGRIEKDGKEEDR